MKIGVILLTLGGPRSLDEIPTFIKNFTGTDLPERALKQIIERYKLIGGYSPLPEITEKQAKALQKLLPEGFLCKVAFRYSNPNIEETIKYFVNEKFEKIIFFLLSPFYTSVTTGNYINRAEKFIKEKNFSIKYSFIHSWYKNEKFINCWVNKIKKEYLGEEFFLFSAHSLPERLSNEPYKTQIEYCCEKISNIMNIKNWALGWQSIPSNTKEPWIGPEVENVMKKAKELGFNSVLQIPIGFTADHIETLYDIDIIHKNFANQIGLNFHRVSSLNDNPEFISALYEILKESEGVI